MMQIKKMNCYYIIVVIIIIIIIIMAIIIIIFILSLLLSHIIVIMRPIMIIITATVMGCSDPWTARISTAMVLTHRSPGQNGLRFADDISRCIFVNEKFCILIKISQKFVPKGPIDNNPALV